MRVGEPLFQLRIMVLLHTRKVNTIVRTRRRNIGSRGCRIVNLSTTYDLANQTRLLTADPMEYD